MYTGQVKANAFPYVNVRNKPSLEGTKVGKLDPGQAVLATHIQDGWAKVIEPVVSNNADRQWVKAVYLELIEIPDPEPEPEPEPVPGAKEFTLVVMGFKPFSGTLEPDA